MRLLFADGLFWLSVACCLVAQLFIIRSVGGARHVPSSVEGLPRRRGLLELCWAVAPAVGLAVLLVVTWHAIRDAAPRTPAPTHAVTWPA